MVPLNDLRVISTQQLIAPAALKDRIPPSDEAARVVLAGRAAVENILSRRDDRLLVIVGPCSIHDTAGALEYAGRLVELRRELGEQLEILMRVYFEKPRTTLGWKGLINDPHLDDSYDIGGGLALARELLREIAELGRPRATEFLDPIVPQYIADLVSWAAIGTARWPSGCPCRWGSRTGRTGIARRRLTPCAPRGIRTVFWGSTSRG